MYFDLFAQTYSSPRIEHVVNILTAIRDTLLRAAALLFNQTTLQILVPVVILSLLVWLGVMGVRLESNKPKPKDPYKRGRFLLAFEEAKELADDLRPSDDPGLPFGGLQAPSIVRRTHFAFFGRTGSAKTIKLRFLMQSALPTIGLVPDQRALIYDPKLDFLSILYGMAIRCPIKILCPFDLRSVAWDMARDCTEPATAIEIASIIIPEEEGHNRYFPDAVRDLLQGVLTSFLNVTPNVWTLRDVIHAMTQPQYLRQILTRCAATRRLLGYLDNDRNFADVLTTINTKLGPLVPIAACWDRAVERVSLDEWQRGDFILVLGNHEKLRSTLDTVNRILFKRAMEVMLAADESESRRTWLFMDEIREAKKLDGLSRLITKGRGPGVCVCLAAQGIEGIRDAFGEQAGEELASQAAQLAFLPLSSAVTAEWASRILGKYERREYRKGYSGGNDSASEEIVNREAVKPSELLSLPQANPKNGIQGYFISSEIGAWRATIPGDVVSKTLLPADPNVPDFLPRPASHQYLTPWNDDDLARLKLKQEPEAPTTDNGTSAPGNASQGTSRLRIVTPKH